MSVHHTYWLHEAEKMPFRMAELQLQPFGPETELATDCFRRLEKAARCLVSFAYMDPDQKLRDAGVCCIRVGTVYFADIVQCLYELHQIAEYYRAPLPPVPEEIA